MDFERFDAQIEEHTADDILAMIKTAPPVDAAPVVHGRWFQVVCHEDYEDGFVDRLRECCSRCHKENGNRMTDYCPNCGARMDLPEGEEA